MEDKRHVRVGILGAGYWGTYAHIPAVVAHPHASLVAVHNWDQAKVDKVAKDFSVPRPFIDAHELLEQVALDAVIVSSTPNVHFQHAKAALEKGLHVLIEKPITLTAAHARELCELAEQKGVQLILSAPWHYTRHAIEARRLIQEGELGNIKMISILMTNPVHELLKGINTKPTHDSSRPYMEPERGSYDDPDIAGGGQLFCQVTHPAAYISYLTGARPKEVFAQLDYYAPLRDIYDVLTIKLDNGAIASLASTGATPGSRRNYEVRIFGEKGVMFLELWNGTFSRIDFQNQEVTLPDLEPEERYPERAPANNLIECVLGNATNDSPGALGLASIEIVEAARRSATAGKNEVLF